ncbi:MAG: hypothetical protein LCH63_17130 [Candidatus Melainabacteria bacterium]|nr:hypothetical protein [Candidatus Melainabacteria bacterium]
MKTAPRISVHVGTHFQKEEKPKSNTADLFKGYSEKVIAAGYRAYLRGDRLDSRCFEHFVDKSRQHREKQERLGAKPHRVVKVTQEISDGRLRRLEGRHVWALTLRENISQFLLSIFRLDKNVRRRG